MRITKDGDVGIGTSSPKGKLEVNLDDNKDVRFSRNATSIFSGDGLAHLTDFMFYNNANGRYWDLFVRGSVGAEPDALGFHFFNNSLEDGDTTNPANWAPRSLHLLPNGNVGIGTAIPAETLDVRGNIQIKNPLPIGVAGELVFPHGSMNNWGLRWRAHDTGASMVKMILDAKHNSASWAEKFTIQSDGNVGIGTASPAVKLQIESNFSGGGGTMIIKNADSNGHGAIDFHDSNGIVVGNIGWRPDWDAFTINDLHGKNTVMNTAGNVGIGTTSPAGKLDVNGAIYQRGGQLHADYVFESDYNLESIREHADFMWKNKHLAAIPKAKVDENGMEIVEVGSHRKGIVEELEKAHIYISQLKDENEAIKEHNQNLEVRLAKLEARFNKE